MHHRRARLVFFQVMHGDRRRFRSVWSTKTRGARSIRCFGFRHYRGVDYGGPEHALDRQPTVPQAFTNQARIGTCFPWGTRQDVK